jgi:diguanylate cyclase (GGDEF)-like protein
MQSETNSETFAGQEKPLDEALVKELQKLAELIRQQSSALPGEENELALVRVVRNVSPENWARFASTHGLTEWLALSLNCDLTESIERFMDGYKRLAFQSEHDALTGIGNRRQLARHLRTEIDRAQRSGTEVTVIFMYLDEFKRVNDTWGHACGDTVLVRLAQLLRRSVRHYDIVTRIGGEEFVILLPSSSCWTGMMLANRLLEEFRQEVFECDGHTFSMTFSAGVSSLGLLEEDISAEALLKSADSAMYEAKHKGRNVVVLANRGKMARNQASLVHSAEKQFLFSGSDAE